MPESINPVLILTILGIVVVLALAVYIDPFGFRDHFKNTQENFDGLTALNNKIFEKMSPMATPNVVNANILSPDIPQNSANELNSIIFPGPDTMKTPNVVNTDKLSKDIQNNSANELNNIIFPDLEDLVTMTKPAVKAEKQPETFTNYINEVDESIFSIPPLTDSLYNIDEQNYIPNENNFQSFELHNNITNTENVYEPFADTTNEMVNELKQTGTVESSFELPTIIYDTVKPILPQNRVFMSSLQSQSQPFKLADTAAETIQNELNNVTPNGEVDKKVQNTGALYNTLNINANVLAGAQVSKNTGIVNTFTNLDVLSAFPLK